MNSRTEQNAVTLHRVEKLEEAVKNSVTFTDEQKAAMAAVVNVYRGILAIKVLGTWLLVLAAGASTLVIAYGHLKEVLPK